MVVYRFCFRLPAQRRSVLRSVKWSTVSQRRRSSVFGSSLVVMGASFQCFNPLFALTDLLLYISILALVKLKLRTSIYRAPVQFILKLCRNVDTVVNTASDLLLGSRCHSVSTSLHVAIVLPHRVNLCGPILKLLSRHVVHSPVFASFA